jgi:cyclophilin family peptidyl-prolyl cis-trans isomerase/HEAT repeat protein
VQRIIPRRGRLTNDTDAAHPARCIARHALSVIAAAALAGCAPHVPPTGSSAGTTISWSTQDVELYADLLAAADGRRTDTGLVRRGLANPQTAVRVEAVLCAGQNHMWPARAMLRALLASRDTAVAATVAYALGLYPDTASIAALGEALHGPSTVAEEAAWTLGEIGEPARAVVERALGEPSPPQPAVPGLLLAAAKLRPVPVALIVPYLTGARAAAAPAVAEAAAEALSRTPAPAGVRALLDVLHASDPRVRIAAARGLGVRAAGDSLGPIARDALAGLASDSDAHARAVAIRVLSSYGTAVRPAVLAALHDPDANVRISAGQVLDRVLGPGRDDWNAAFDADSSLAYRRGVVAAAVRAGVILEIIDHDNADRWQRAGDWRYRAAAAEAGEGTPITRVVDLTLPLTRDPDPRVRAAAYGVFSSWLDSADAGHHPWRRQYIEEALHDEDCVVRSIVLGAMDHAAMAADAPIALRAYATAQHDSQTDARVASLRLLADAWAHDSARFPDSVRSAIRALPVPSSWIELSQAGEGSPWSSWRAAVQRGAAPHDRVWYDSIVRAVVLPSLAGHPIEARITTSRGVLVIDLYGAEAPLTVANFVALARAGFYRGTAFHRVVPAFVAQDGDPRGDGSGGPPWAIRDELNRRRYQRGALGMALSGPDTGGSQYFLTLTPQPHLDGHYTVFGMLRDGFGVLDQITQGDSIRSVEIQ